MRSEAAHNYVSSFRTTRFKSLRNQTFKPLVFTYFYEFNVTINRYSTSAIKVAVGKLMCVSVEFGRCCAHARTHAHARDLTDINHRYRVSPYQKIM